MTWWTEQTETTHEKTGLDLLGSSCPICETGLLVKRTRKETGTNFLGCTEYFSGDCSFNVSLKETLMMAIMRHTEFCEEDALYFGAWIISNGY